MQVLADKKKRGGISRFISWIIILLVIVLVALWFVARSDTGRRFVENKLGKHFGLDVSISKMKIGWPYTLVLENVRTKGFEAAGTAGFSAAEVKLGRGWQYWHLTLSQLIVRVKQDDKSIWQPLSLARLGDLKDSSLIKIVLLTSDLRNSVRLNITNSNMEWLQHDGLLLADARDIDFCLQPAKVGKRQLHYYFLSIYSYSGLALGQGRELHREWLTTSGVDYIELPGSSMAGAAPVETSASDKPAADSIIPQGVPSNPVSK